MDYYRNALLTSPGVRLDSKRIYSLKENGLPRKLIVKHLALPKINSKPINIKKWLPPEMKRWIVSFYDLGG